MNTRMMVRCLWSTLQIPILALVDADPHGNLKRFTYFTLEGGVSLSFPCTARQEFAVDKLLSK